MRNISEILQLIEKESHKKCPGSKTYFYWGMCQISIRLWLDNVLTLEEHNLFRDWIDIETNKRREKGLDFWSTDGGKDPHGAYWFNKKNWRERRKLMKNYIKEYEKS